MIRVSRVDRSLKGELTLDGSKSISNRLLILQALSEGQESVRGLSTSKDTTTLQKLLAETGPDVTLDAGAAGTTFRFMTAYLARQEGTQVLTGSERMKQRPIGVLVDALRQLGASIEYLGQEGYPPLAIHAPQSITTNQLQIPASVSSQYISALLMIGPTLPQGLHLALEGNIVSRPYIELTLHLMKRFGIQYEWDDHTISVEPQAYQAVPVQVEADWSAASYYYAMAAFGEEVDLTLNGLFENSFQGDAVLPEMMTAFGVETQFSDDGLRLTNNGQVSKTFEWDFIRCPDIAQTLAVVCAGLGVEGRFTGLVTLSIKETDRIAALQTELSKVGVSFDQDPGEPDFYLLSGSLNIEEPQFATYEDHRMAMAFAPLAMLNPIRVEHPKVVEKSYPHFWEDLAKLEFEVTDH